MKDHGHEIVTFILIFSFVWIIMFCFCLITSSKTEQFCFSGWVITMGRLLSNGYRDMVLHLESNQVLQPSIINPGALQTE